MPLTKYIETKILSFECSTLDMQNSFSDLFVCVLSQDLDRDLLIYVLMKLPSDFFPFFANPPLLTDFLTDCCNAGGQLAVLALSSLYELITKYNVNYPDYFYRLYALLTPESFSMKYSLPRPAM